MARIDRRKADQQILRSYIDIRHERWFREHFAGLTLLSWIIAIGLVVLSFTAGDPLHWTGSAFVCAGVLIALTPYVLMVAWTPKRQRLKAFGIVFGILGGGIGVMVLLSWLLPQ